MKYGLEQEKSKLMGNLLQLLLDRFLPFALLVISPHITSHLPEQTLIGWELGQI